ncbi:LuxR C-terminal-related transcriptional regulator [Deinococcus sp.]|uniref:LuxR C-terminal-related transcriptional regulator n=1 Tax=Deinococcus sp. TaxID=47478 RepID=UPI002869C832|nr:LuxR C-terminal-related transcriptional regulator [Deinococcus sp.]
MTGTVLGQARVPVPLTPLHGRQPELQALRDLLSRADTRLVSVIGPGGVGKTRLAQAAALALGDDFQDGVAWVNLAPLADPALVWPTVALSLGLEASAGQDAGALGAALRGVGLLLVLDNFEHLDSAASGLPDLLGAAPGVRVLVTSRHPLRLRGEHEIRLDVFAVPAADAELEALIHNDAAQLFVGRALDVHPHFRLDAATGSLVRDIVRLLDGWPLALELAAARLRLFSAEELLLRLERPLELLRGGPRDAMPHQRTLHDTLRWSESLLSPELRTVFARLAVLEGRFTVEAAQAVGGATLDDLGQLVDESLLRRVPEDGPLLFVLLVPVREYALEVLQTLGAEQEARQAHAQYFAAPFANTPDRLGYEDTEALMVSLERDLPNHRAALNWLLEQAPADAGHLWQLTDLGGGLTRFWWLSGRTLEGTVWVERALAHVTAQAGTEPQRVQTQRLRGRLGALYMIVGHPAARPTLELALQEARDLGDLEQTRRVIANLVPVYLTSGADALAEGLLHEGLAMARAADDPEGMAWNLDGLAQLAYNRLDFREAARLFGEGRGHLRAAGELSQLCVNLANAGSVHGALTQYDLARELTEEALHLAQQLGLSALVPLIKGNLADVAVQQGDLSGAARLTCEALEAVHRFGTAAHHLAALLACSADILLRRQQAQAGAVLLGIVDRLEAEHPTYAPVQTQTFSALRDRARRALPDPAFRAAWEMGQLWTTAQIVAWALGSLNGQTPAASVPAATPAPPGDLTRREAEVLTLLASGLSDKRIASELGMSPRTVNSHLTRIFSKLNVGSRTAAARYALDHGLA